MKKRKPVPYRVTYGNYSGLYWSRNRANAVAQFRREKGVTLKTDNDTGGWKGGSAEVVK